MGHSLYLFARCNCPDWLLSWKGTGFGSGKKAVTSKASTDLHLLRDKVEEFTLMHTEIQNPNDGKTEVCASVNYEMLRYVLCFTLILSTG